MITDLDGFNMRTYICLHSIGLDTLGQIVDFINQKGPEWYRHIPNFGINELKAVENALAFYKEIMDRSEEDTTNKES